MGAQGGHATPSGKQNPYADKKPKGKGKKIIALVSVFACVAIAAVIAISMLVQRANDPVNQFEAAIEKGDFVEAAQIYRDEIRYGDSGQIAEAEKLVVNQAGSIESAYTKNELEYDEALTQLQELEKLRIVSSAELSPFIESINELRTSRMAYQSAQTSIGREDYAQAINELNKVIQRDENYANAQQQIVSSVTSYKNQVFAELSTYDANKSYSAAITKLNDALKVVPNDADFLAKIDDYNSIIAADTQAEVDVIVKDARDMVANNKDYERALSTLRNALNQYRGNESINSAIREITDTHVREILAEADAFAIDKKYTNAITVLEGGQRLYPDGTDWRARINDYREFLPVFLTNLETLSNVGNRCDLWVWNTNPNSTDRDNIENTRANTIGFNFPNHSGDEFYRRIEYFTDSKYSRFTGLFLLHFDSRNTTDRYQLRISADNTLIYTSPVLTNGVLPINIDIDITGASVITFTVSDIGSNWRRSNGNVAIAEAGFQK
jgi:tetratricopeptide (TPR) repeat protein